MTTDSEQKNSGRQRRLTAEQTRERDRQAAALKIGGATFDAISRALGFVDASGAYKAYRRHLGRAADPDVVDEHRALELARLEDLWQAWYPRGVGDPGDPERGRAAIEPDVEAAQKLLQIHDRKVRLLALHREPTYDPTEELLRYAKENDLDPDEVLRQADGILAGMKDRRPR